MNAPDTIITPSPADKVAVDAALAGAMISGGVATSEPAAEPDIVETVEASLAAVDQELAHLEEVLRDDLAPFSQPIADVSPAPSSGENAQPSISVESASANKPQPADAADPLAAEETKLTQDIDALIEQTAVAPEATIDAPPDTTPDSAEAVTADAVAIDASAEAAIDAHATAEAPPIAATPEAVEVTAQPDAQAVEATQGDEIEGVVPELTATESAEVADPSLDAEAESLAQSATADLDDASTAVVESEPSSEPVTEEPSTPADTSAPAESTVAPEASDNIAPETTEAVTAAAESPDAAEPTEVQAEVAAPEEPISTAAAETAAIVAEELAAASAVAPEPSETPAPPPATARLRSIAVAPLKLAIRLPILLLIAIDLPFRWMSAPLKNIIGLVGIATAAMAIATFLAAPWLKPAEAQDAAPQATTETQPATHTDSPSEPPSSAHPAAH